jgi:outer membrane protein assembly factor BamB
LHRKGLMRLFSFTARLQSGLLAAGVLLGGAVWAQWPQFRGPTGLGYTSETNLPVKWGGPSNENVRWKSPLVGQGHASPIVENGCVIVCTAHWPPGVTAREMVMPEHHVLCYRAEDGQLLWDTQVPPGPWLRTDFRSGPGGGYAASTPATDGKLIYCVFGSSVMAALDYTGKIVWRQEIVPSTFDVTVGSSPVLYRDTVILLCAMAKSADSRVVALDKATGKVKWEQKFPDMGFGHSTPVLMEAGGRTQMLVLASGAQTHDRALRSLDPANGQTLWWCRGSGDAASPAFGAGVIYFDSGRGGMGVAVAPGGTGDVSQTHMRWTVAQVPEGIGSPIIVGKHVYRLHTPGVLKCWEVDTGRQVYAERLEGISTTWASPIADAEGRLYFANAGKSYVLQAGPELRVLAVNDLRDGNHPSPAVAGGRLYLVGLKNVYCVGASP